MGRTCAVLTATFVALALGLLNALVATTERIQSPNPIGLVALAGAALALLVVAPAPVRGAKAAGWQGLAHTVGAFVFFIASALGTTVLRRA